MIIVDERNSEEVEHFSYLDCIIKNESMCTIEVKTRIAIAKIALKQKETLFTCRVNNASLRKND